jgi:putative tricarboxylic transport membrane protein
MSNPRRPRLFRPETLTALGIIAVAVAFMAPTAALKPISAFLPATMLIGMAVLSLFLLLVDQRAAGAGEDAPPMTASPKRVLGAFLMIVCYALSTDYVGFYISTAVVIPLVAYVFGYRSLPGLALATCIVLGAIYLVFDVAMAQTFPVGRLWKS